MHFHRVDENIKLDIRLCFLDSNFQNHYYIKVNFPGIIVQFLFDVFQKFRASYVHVLISLTLMYRDLGCSYEKRNCKRNNRSS